MPTLSLGPAHDHSGTVTATSTQSTSTPPPITMGHERSAPRTAAHVPPSAGGTKWSTSSDGLDGAHAYLIFGSTAA